MENNTHKLKASNETAIISSLRDLNNKLKSTKGPNREIDILCTDILKLFGYDCVLNKNGDIPQFSSSIDAATHWTKTIMVDRHHISVDICPYESEVCAATLFWENIDTGVLMKDLYISPSLPIAVLSAGRTSAFLRHQLAKRNCWGYKYEK